MCFWIEGYLAVGVLNCQCKPRRHSGVASVPGLTELVWLAGDNVEVGVELDVVFAAAAFGVIDLV